MNIPEDLKYTKDHEWIREESGKAVIGITDFAQKELGDIVYIEIETEGEDLAKEEVFGTIEAVKTVSDMFMPISGQVVKRNEMLDDTPELVNSDPYGDGWMVEVTVADAAELNDLMTAQEYAQMLED
ncbi:MAG: glycine cleavage system protein GcvH [Bacteroidetes bacterium]|nr:glycine cleavage system protein GcvH [Bacteroidota bacterium]MBT5530106.1 glycine cleavage system protein GcvH [Cytophagia bacterium]MBT3421513.1 glycine cleavage system protein GcvH [Bacteroidota bacterium]MBT3800727.1 glycine cleavage system protein GcvH [Bacteroidota bacterium]MBT3934871.1 glycine cleavage system protein GcvH [Bacteroidota bacterium]